MSENFAALLDESLSTLEMQPGSIVTGVVLDVDKEWVTVHVGLKSEGVISLDEFRNNDGSIEIASGDEVQVALEAVEDGYGETRISREKARKIATWKKLEEALETGEFVEGKVLTRVKGGFSVEVDVVKAFLPGSLVDIRPVKEAPELENTVQEFKVIKLDYKRNNVVLSRKAVLEKINSAEKVELLKNLDEGQIVKGVVKNLTDYGAFVDLGGLDGLLHITDISWSRVTNPSEVLSLGEEIDVKILSFDKEKLRVSLGLKQIQNDPWETIEGKYSVGGVYEATVSNLTDYGCFAELEQGVEGLIHLSELDWTNKNIHPSKVVDLEEKIKVMVLEIDTDSNFGTASSYTETTNSKALTGLANNTTYHWRVTARNTRSAASSFTTHLATPNLTAPTDNAVNQPLNPTFTWDAVPGADNYEIEEFKNQKLLK